ncbi:hypothetical protein L1D29_17800 [Shewanella insulae]|uniref:hypothetical protein n=1 Tax=Shewanella insulae TaxID=2681496 RepID=UPI001EFE286B|nr:hypothetical protein [Shewanella insulae]MCG9714661.1 hypothetical protein [Shewanella insulae]
MTLSIEAKHQPKSAPATLQKNAIRVDGRLTMSREALDFTSYSSDCLYGPYHLPLKDIVKVETCWGKGAGILPITHDGIQVTLGNGERYQFIVADPDAWIESLSA